MLADAAAVAADAAAMPLLFRAMPLHAAVYVVALLRGALPRASC